MDPFGDPSWRRAMENLQRVSEQVSKAMPPDHVRRLIEQITLPQENIRRLIEQITLPQENVRRIIEQIATTMPRESTRRLIEHATLPQENIQRITEQVTRSYVLADLQLVTERIAAAQQVSVLARFPSWVDVQDAGEHLKAEVGEADGDPRQPLGTWLASRSTTVQLVLLVAGLELLDALSKLFAEAVGVDVPDTVEATTTVCFKLVALLLLLMNEQSKPPE